MVQISFNRIISHLFLVFLCCVFCHSVTGRGLWLTSCCTVPEHPPKGLHQRWEMIFKWHQDHVPLQCFLIKSSDIYLYLLKSCFNVELYRGRATGGEDEEAGGKVCSSSPGAPHWETWDPTGEALSSEPTCSSLVFWWFLPDIPKLWWAQCLQVGHHMNVKNKKIIIILFFHVLFLISDLFT